MADKVPPKADDKLKLDRDPTPAEEAEAFQNPDEKRAVRDNAHTLALLDRKQGFIGRLVGSSQPSLTIAFTVILISGLGLLVCLFGMIWQPDVFSDLARLMGTSILTVAGYVFGVKSSDKEN